MSFFQNLDKTDKRTLNSKVLIVDGTNTIIRSMSVSNQTNDLGIPIGGIVGFLMSVGSAIKNIMPTRCIIVFDGKNGSYNRRQIFEGYKANRDLKIGPRNPSLYTSKEQEQASLLYQIGRLKDYLQYLPMQLLIIDDIEADDTISYLNNVYFKDSKEVYIMSTDRDFYQLISEKTKIYKPGKNYEIFDINKLKREYGLIPENFIHFKCFDGDDSDNVGGIKGIGLKTLQKHIPIIFEDKRIELEDIFNYLNENIETLKKYKPIPPILEQRELLERNYKIMQLSKTLINEKQKNEINEILSRPIPKSNKFKLLQLSGVDGVNTIMTNIVKWMDDVFYNLDCYTN
jgi:DNA polymerase-1